MIALSVPQEVVSTSGDGAHFGIFPDEKLHCM